MSPPTHLGPYEFETTQLTTVRITSHFPTPYLLLFNDHELVGSATMDPEPNELAAHFARPLLEPRS